MGIPRLAMVGLLLAGALPGAGAQESLAEQKEAMLRELREVHDLTDAQYAKVRDIVTGSRYIGQGNPAVTRHPATPAQCEARLEEAGLDYREPAFEQVCGAKYMAPLYDPARQVQADAPACIDRFEFPNIPCRYPVVWVRAREAALICEVMDKRLCDAHEWEGACAGALREPDYRFELAAGLPPNQAFARLQRAHNEADKGKELWAYGSEYQRGVCAAGSAKSPGCDGGGWAACGSNTYPSGFFPRCVSLLGVYDQHGNAAEHMNLPLAESQMASRGSRELGYTEMKGSWFIWDSFRAHPDQCRWRAPYWHGSRVMDTNSHHNYHLGFRCCRDVERQDAE